MTAKATLRKANDLVARGELREARRLLLEDGYVKRIDPEIQKAFAEVIPVCDRLKEQLEGPLGKLARGSVAERRKAAKWLLGQATRSRSTHLEEWLADPRTIDLLLDAVRAEDAKLVENAAGALAYIITGYFADLRAHDALLPLLKSKGQQTRFFAVLGIGGLADEDAWKELVPLLEDRAVKVRAAVAGELNRRASRPLKKAARAELLEVLERAATDSDPRVRKPAELGLARLD